MEGRPGEAIGRSRGGLATKIHLAGDRRSRPPAVTFSAGSVNDRIRFEAATAGIRVRRRRPGRSRTRRELVVAGKGCRHEDPRFLSRGVIRAPIPERIDQFNGHIRRGETIRFWLPRRLRVDTSPPDRAACELAHNANLTACSNIRARIAHA